MLKGVLVMFPNLLGLKAYYHLTDEDMGRIIGVSRSAFGQKMKSGKFLPDECRAICRYFSLPFDYLFSLAAETVPVKTD